MKYGYARGNPESLRLQIEELRRFEVDEIYEETRLGAKRWPQLTELLRQLRPGDALVVWSLDKLGRTIKQLLPLIERLEKAGVDLVSITDHIDLQTIHALGSMERKIISERTAEAMQKPGKKGRPSKDPADIKKALKMYHEAQWTSKQIQEATGLSAATLYKYIKQEGNDG